MSEQAEKSLRLPDDAQLAHVLIACFALAALVMLRSWGWGVPSWQDLPSVRLDLALHGTDASLAVRAEASELTDYTNQVLIFHEANEAQLMSDYPLSSVVSLETLAVVPGLANTLSWNALDESAIVSQHMVPQGIAVSDRYVFISAYDGSYAANSVIYLVNRTDGALVKTVVLAGQPHVGGLAWDSEHERLWICSRRRQQAQLVALTLEHLEEIEDGSVVPVRYDATALLHGPKRASFVEYFEGSLYVGFFNATAPGRLYRYVLTDDGLLAPGSRTEAIESWELPACAQGVTLTHDRVYVSTSHSKKTSELLVFERDAVYDHTMSLPVHGGRVIYGFAEAVQPAEGVGSTGSLASGSAALETESVDAEQAGGEAFEQTSAGVEGVAGESAAGEALSAASDEDEAAEAAEGTASDEDAVSTSANAGEADTSIAAEAREDEHRTQAHGEHEGIPGIEELLLFLFGEPGEQEGSSSEAEGVRPPFALGLARMAADRSAISGEMAVGMAQRAYDLAQSGDHAEQEEVSYAEDPLLSCDLPPMLEDLTVCDGHLFAVHESGAAIYRMRYGVGIDRVVSYPLSLLETAIAHNVRVLALPATEQGEAAGSAAVLALQDAGSASDSSLEDSAVAEGAA